MRILITLILLCNFLRAQEEFVPPASKFITSFPFRILTGGIITLKATVANYADTLNFILDTGSGGISLDSLTAVRLNINTILSDRTIRGIAGIRQVRFIYDMPLHLPKLTVDSLDFHINDYEVLTSSYGEKIDGIIGFSFLSRYIVKIDYDSSKVYVYTKGRFKYPRGGFLIRPALNNIPIFATPVKDNREVSNRYYFDTGAGMCLLLSSDFVNDSNFISTKRKWFTTQAEGLGGKAAMKQGVVKQVKIGPYKFKNVPTYIFDDEFNVTSYPNLGGLIGNDLLRRFNLIINYERRDLYLVPNSHLREPFDYSYTGLGMYVIDGEIRIIDVMEGSPAEEAGFKPGDIVMAIENNFTNNIQAYKTLLQTPGGRLKVLVLRDDGPLLLNLRVKSIL
ncbi:MAG: aspartyl protease family protein [Chitinophagaceae bacterium]|nr:aspartyl protease family protein [Chitinophagaceae bacterium]